jgi:phage regulator Rha-like protein
MVDCACVIGKDHRMNAIKTNINTTLIIHGSNNQICVSSLDVAKEFGRHHKNVLKTLDGLLADGTISWLESKPRNYIKLGRKYRYFELNTAGFLKAMPFIGGKKSHEGQKILVDAFIALGKEIEKQSKEKEKLSCQVARLTGKDSRAILCDKIQEFVVYAKDQGSNNADRYFGSITNLAHKTVGITNKKVTQVRELLTAIQLSQLSTIELIVEDTLAYGMALGLPYKEIYKSIALTLDGPVMKRPVLGC